MTPGLVQGVNAGLYRDIGDWILGGAFGQRNNQGSPSETIFLMTLTLKSYPEMPLGFNQNPASSGVTMGGYQQNVGGGYRDN